MKINYDFDVKKKKMNVLSYLLISLLGIAIASIVSFLILNVVFDYNTYITSDNRGDYLAIVGTHCSVVFLTTSLMAMLSERNRYIYWVDMITTMLIFPEYLSFFALVVYSLSTIAVSFIGLLFGIGSIVIGSFLFGIVAVTILFSRMVLIYYQDEKNKSNIKQFLFEKLEKNEHKKYLVRMKEITYIKAETREFMDVYDNLNLIEACLLKIWEKEPRKDQKIIHPINVCEEIYVDMISDLSIKFPQEIQDYIDNHTEDNATIKALGYMVYPILLNSYVDNHRIDLFDRTLCKWSKISEQKFEVIDYIERMAEKNTELIADYYSKLFNPFNHELRLPEAPELYIEVLGMLYDENPNVYEVILQYRGNRSAIYQAFYELDNVEDFLLDVLAIVSEGEGTKTEQYKFIELLDSLLDDEIIRHRNGTDEEKENIEKKPILYKVVESFSMYKNEKDLDFILDKIIKFVSDLDSPVYVNAGNDLRYYVKFEKWALDYSLISVKKELEREDRKESSQKYKEKIDVLQKYLEILNYTGGRVVKNDYNFRKGHFENNQLAIYVYSRSGERMAVLTKEFGYQGEEEFDFETNAILIDGFNCSKSIIDYVVEKGLVMPVGQGRKIAGKPYPIAIVNKEWLSSLEEC